MSQETAAKKDTQRLQRAIVEGLEDVKAQDIQVFNTEHLSPLFERVIVASGTSNRQTKALAASVRDAVRDAGFNKPRVEGEENGEWIIVDCGAAVAHIMQPAIRTYYHLEEIWGDKPVRLKFGAPKPAAPAPAPKPAAAKKAPIPSLRRSSAARTAVREAEAEAKKAPARRKPAATRSAGAAAPAKAAAKKATAPAKAPAQAAAKKAPAKKAPAKSAARKAAAPSAGGKAATGRTAAKAPAKSAAPRNSAASKSRRAE
ncbi:ribosome silencing factor [Ramlibacter rhizophilus]|uniref:Ribosomal silencing factor RsfS n=1 Tax=Ramlibacter rhizophilus TaxID=1781167 RepID=A0A4Z0BZQ5_9BURK|nr:ribosome silencing factor [Ramlibacter rhizophilus]TFZ04837.1 ribosome silencing factor [Ramlibacter rhizophilus]